MKTEGRKRFRGSIAAASACALAAALFFAGVKASFAFPEGYESVCDLSYWPSQSLESGAWTQVLTPAGINYHLYVPPQVRADDASAGIPLIVAFHGSTGKGIAKDSYGRLFSNPKSQGFFGEKGAAVLVMQSRLEYFTDTAAYARLIDNVMIRTPCISRSRVALWGFSQGAAFALELAMDEPGLARAAAIGSSYYSASAAELLRARKLKVWYATARNDKGIWEQGHRTGRLLAAVCPDSKYVEYESRGHFFIDPSDESGGESFIEWLAKVLRQQ